MPSFYCPKIAQKEIKSKGEKIAENKGRWITESNYLTTRKPLYLKFVKVIGSIHGHYHNYALPNIPQNPIR